MSSIFSLFNTPITFHQTFIDENFQRGKSRGPQYSKLVPITSKMLIGYHSMYVPEEDTISSCVFPFIDGDVTVMCNGVIYNHKELFRFMNEEPKTMHPCEIIIVLYRKYGIEHTIQLLDGSFSFILIDTTPANECARTYIVRDPYGSKPLYMLYPKPIATSLYHSLSAIENENIYGFATEVKMLYGLYNTLNNTDINTPIVQGGQPAVLADKKKRTKKASATASTSAAVSAAPFSSTKQYNIRHFEPGTYSLIELSPKNISWSMVFEEKRYHTAGFNSIMYHLSPQYYVSEVVQNIQRYLIRAVEKRCANANRKMAVLLSGGLDSSLVAALVQQYHVTNNLPPVETYAIGFARSEDLVFARKVAEYLGTDHKEIIVSEGQYASMINDTVKIMETYDVATIRAATANYILAKYIAENSEAKVIFNGDGADDYMGGHMYMYMAAEAIEFDREVRMRIKNTHQYDMLRAEKCMGAFGLEATSPFLDSSLINYYLAIPPQLRFHSRNEKCEKYLLRLSFTTEYYRNSNDTKILPDSVLWRRREEMSDGLAGQESPFYDSIMTQSHMLFIKRYINEPTNYSVESNIYTDMALKEPLLTKARDYLVPKGSEEYIYRIEFETHFAGLGKSLMSEYWMPKYFIKMKDPSAHRLEVPDDSVSEKDNNSVNGDNDIDDNDYENDDNANDYNNMTMSINNGNEMSMDFSQIMGNVQNMMNMYSNSQIANSR